MKKKLISSTIAIGAVCAVVGASTGIASSSAASKATAASATTATAAMQAGARPDGMRGPGGPGGPGGGHGHGGPGGGPGGGGIHSESVRPDPDGTGFVTEVSDSGTLSAVDGNELTIKEGTAKETFDTVDVTADGTVTVERNGATSSLAALKVGDHVRVSKDGTNTRIHATTAAWEAKQQKQADQARPAAPTWPAA